MRKVVHKKHRTVTLESLARMVADGFEATASKEELREGLKWVREDLKASEQRLREEIRAIGVYAADVHSLKKRVARIEAHLRL